MPANKGGSGLIRHHDEELEGQRQRLQREIAHGRQLAQSDPDLVWGWGTPAGRLRAERRAALILEQAEAGPDRRLLEVGCGSGLFTEKLARCGAEIVAVEPSPDLLQLARQRRLPADRVRFVEGGIEDCDVGNGFDAVLGSSVLHHLRLPAALERMFQLLRPGGRLSFAEPNLLNPQILVERLLRRWFDHVSPDETAFVRPLLRRQLQQVGFEVVRIVPFDWLHPRVPPGLIPAVSKIGGLLERTWLVRELSGSLLITARRPD